ncbi:DUF1080 domain-containing protein [Maioricimonas sp. JC845]|uniref:3-keto-disaccharide hydrolase n=1 Tax=Maioricimonas sp. JC845 TaxID=3232138 RepID=UPI00345894B9
MPRRYHTVTDLAARFARSVAIAGLLCLHVATAAADDKEFRPLFNGRDLTGWETVNCAPDTFTVQDGMIVCSGKPIGVMRTDRHYANFILELEWKHLVPKGNAGLFVWSDPLPVTGKPFTRAIEVQILDGRNTENYTSHGDIFPIQGASMQPDRPHPGGWDRCLPSEHRCNPAGEWNHYRVTCRDGDIKLEVNGKLVSGGHDSVPRKGYICLESEGGIVHFRNIRIRELPGSDPSPEQTADVDRNWRSLFDGLTLAGWKTHEGLEGRWSVHNELIHLAGDQPARPSGQDLDLWTEDSFEDFQLIVDWRLTGKPTTRAMNSFTADGLIRRDANGNVVKHEILDAGDSGIYLRGSRKAQVNIWCQPMGSGDINAYHKDATLPEAIRRACMPRTHADNPPGQWNRFVITMGGSRVTVELNGETVIADAELPDVPASGPIALQNHGDGIEFRNVYIRDLSE